MPTKRSTPIAFALLWAVIYALGVAAALLVIVAAAANRSDHPFAGAVFWFFIAAAIVLPLLAAPLVRRFGYARVAAFYSLQLLAVLLAISVRSLIGTQLCRQVRGSNRADVAAIQGRQSHRQTGGTEG